MRGNEMEGEAAGGQGQQQKERKKISLALQGGGSHGAFTWGVLDTLLADDRLEIAAVTGSSAGAMNAVVMTQGFIENGRAGARAKLSEFWRSLSVEGQLNPLQREVFRMFFSGWPLQTQITRWWADIVTHFASPYDFNPLNLNPLRDQLLRMVDFPSIRAFRDYPLYVGATNVHTSQIQVWHSEELQVEHVLASACLPFIFQAVEIDGVPYWDGGYRGNPALFPLFYGTKCPDIVIVQITPFVRLSTPQSARDIQDRLNEITFNGALMAEMRAVDFVNRLVDSGKLSRDEYLRINLHCIDGSSYLEAYSAVTKLDSSWHLMESLFLLGKKVADQWLATTFDSIGVKGTLDLRRAFTAA